MSKNKFGVKIFDFTVRGMKPIMQARHPTPKEEAKIKEVLKSGKKDGLRGTPITDAEQFKMHSYKTKSGKYYQPSEMFEAAMTEAAKNFKVPGIRSNCSKFIKGGIIVEPFEIIHKNQKPTMDARWGKNPFTGGAVWVVRPRFDKWELSFKIKLLQIERISADMLYNILEYAGMYVGIGAWRPKFGQFEIVKFKEVK